MTKFKKRINWKGIISAVLTVATLLGVAAGITAFVKNDTKTISSLTFKRGDLDENGDYIASETAIYTKDAFECIGLRVEPDFEFKGTYDVCYYDCDERIIEKISGLSGIYDEDYPRAEIARVVIHPELEEDQEKISFYQVNMY